MSGDILALKTRLLCSYAADPLPVIVSQYVPCFSGDNQLREFRRSLNI